MSNRSEASVRPDLALFSQGLIRPDGFLHSAIKDAGTGAILIAVLGRTWCALYISGRKTSVLVTRGPYSVVRNPLYFFSFIGAAGIGLEMGSVLLAAIVALPIVVVFLVVARQEEAALHELFGTAFENYAARVPGFWPKLSLWWDEASLEIYPRKVIRNFLDSALMLLVIPVADVIEALHAAGWLTVLVRLP